MKALIIEDDLEEQDFQRKSLTALGYTCDVVGDGLEGYSMLLNNAYDLAIVDVLLPGMRGKEIIRRIRAEGNQTYIIIVSCLGDIADRVAGLNAGADDYMPKPASMSELKARINAFNRRFSQAKRRFIEAHGIVIDTVSRTCTRNGRSILLSKIEFAVLECLMANRGNLVTKEMLVRRAWAFEEEPTTDIVPPHISRIRNKLVLEGEIDPIENRRGEGYVFL